MKRETKNLITRADVKKELAFLNRADLSTHLVLTLGFSVFLLPMAFGLGLSFLSAELLLSQGVKTFIGILIILFIASPIPVMAVSLVFVLAERSLLMRGYFEVTVLPLSYKDERLKGRNRMAEVLHFRGFQAFEVGHTVYQLSDAGEEFYVVSYSGKKQIKFVYPLDMYEYKQ